MEFNLKNQNYDLHKDVIKKIKDLINYKNLEPGEKLPSERILSKKFNVSRTIIRESIQRLEFYGILKSIPQSGTLISNIGVIALNVIIDDILRLNEPEFKSLVETRILLELEIVQLAALRRSKEDLILLETILTAYKQKSLNGESVIQEDILFHLAIVKSSKNNSLNSFMLKIIPEVINNFNINLENQNKIEILEHEEIYLAIKSQDANIAKQKMQQHFKILNQYFYNTKN